MRYSTPSGYDYPGIRFFQLTKWNMMMFSPHHTNLISPYLFNKIVDSVCIWQSVGCLLQMPKTTKTPKYCLPKIFQQYLKKTR